MPFHQQEPRPFTQAGVEWLDPGQIGVYGILNGSGMLYVGKGDIRERLLDHLRNNTCVLVNGATHYVASVHPNPDALEIQLILEYNPPCNQRVG